MGNNCTKASTSKGKGQGVNTKPKMKDDTKNITKSFPQFTELITKRSNMMRMEFLQFLEVKEIVVIALMNKAINKVVDPNKGYITTG